MARTRLRVKEKELEDAVSTVGKSKKNGVWKYVYQNQRTFVTPVYPYLYKAEFKSVKQPICNMGPADVYIRTEDGEISYHDQAERAIFAEFDAKPPNKSVFFEL